MTKHSINLFALLMTIFLTVCFSAVVSVAGNSEDFFQAIADHDIDKIQLLINSGIDINSKDIDGRTGLIVACMNNDFEMVQFLVKKGAKLDKVDSYGNTALIIAAGNGFDNIAEFLVEAGASIAQRNTNNYSALDNADRNLVLFLMKNQHGKITKEMWRQDLKYMVAELGKLHPKLFFKVKKADFERTVKQLDKNIPYLNELQIKIGLAKVVAMVKDGHTNLQIWRDLKKYPIEFYYFPDGLYVYKVTDKYKKALKCKVIKVGDTDIKNVIAKLKTVFPYENEAMAKVWITAYLNAPEILAGLGIIKDMQKGKFVLMDSSGKTFSVYLSPIKETEKVEWFSLTKSGKEPLTLRLSEDRETYAYQYLEDSKTIYFEYNHCSDMPDKPFESFAKELLEFVDNHRVDKFIIDLSANGGGNSDVLNPLIEGIKERIGINRKGHLFGIISNVTYSSAVNNAVQLRDETNIIFVGKAPGEELNNYGDYRLILLPNSHMIVSCSTKHFSMAKENITKFMPDITVDISAKDYFAGKDPVLDAILKYKAK